MGITVAAELAEDRHKTLLNNFGQYFSLSCGPDTRLSVYK